MTYLNWALIMEHLAYKSKNFLMLKQYPDFLLIILIRKQFKNFAKQ